MFAGLFFEYVDVGIVLGNVHAMLRPGGVLVAIVQLPSAQAEVTPSPYTSLAALSSVMHLVPPERLMDLAERSGFRCVEAQTVAASGGKQFAVRSFSVSAPAG